MDELLSSPSSTIIETDRLDAATIESISKLLEKAGGLSIRKTESPRQSLEDFFLGLVEKADREGAETSGATGGAGVAEFLAQKDPAPDTEPGSETGEDKASTAEEDAD